MVDFGGGCCRSCCSSSCDRGKTKSTPSPFDLDWNGLGLEFDKNAKKLLVKNNFLMGKIFDQKKENFG